MFSSSLAFAVAATLLGAAASPAAARIKCKGSFQVTKYGLIATPYCQEEEIARVARNYGFKVTGAEIRKDPLKNVYLCQVIGSEYSVEGLVRRLFS